MSSLSRGLEILEFVAANQATGVTYPNILAQLGMPSTSCFRLLKELTDLKYLCFNAETRKYHVSMKLANIGSSVAMENPLMKLLHPYLEKLRDESNKTCNLGIMGQESGIFLDVIYSNENTIQLLSKIGANFPLHCTALGKVLLAYAPPAKREEILSQELKPLTPRSIPNRYILESQLDQILINGYASEHEESTLGIHCFAAPIFDFSGKNIAAVSMACPYFSLETPGSQLKIIDLVKRYGTQMSEVMGYKVTKGTNLTKPTNLPEDAEI